MSTPIVTSRERGWLYTSDEEASYDKKAVHDFTDHDVRMDYFATQADHAEMAEWANEHGMKAEVLYFIPDIHGAPQEVILRFEDALEAVHFKLRWLG